MSKSIKLTNDTYLDDIIHGVNQSSKGANTTIKNVPTLTNGSNHSAYGGCYYYKIGNRVYVNIGVSGLTAGTNTTLFTLPAGYRPAHYVAAMGIADKLVNTSRIQIASNGTVLGYSDSTYINAQISYDVFQ